jgi:hypothetical protein
MAKEKVSDIFSVSSPVIGFRERMSHVGAKYQPPPLCSLSHDLTTIIMTMGLFGWNENKKHSNTINNSTIEESDQMI